MGWDWIDLDGVVWCGMGMGWDGWDGMGWDGMGWMDGVEWSGVRCGLARTLAISKTTKPIVACDEQWASNR